MRKKKYSKKVKLGWNTKSHHLDGGWEADQAIDKAKEIANMEIEAKAQGKTVAQLIVEQWK